ncbi:hypothetical protein GQX74_009658 [Glossina fuscipes]|nr:hypothetical protein GQX74_009658 [Glossina fuscipes]
MIKDTRLILHQYSNDNHARDSRTNEIVALKKVRMDEEKDGLLVSGFREILILKSCKHANIANLLDVVVGKSLERKSPRTRKTELVLLDHGLYEEVPAAVRKPLYKFWEATVLNHEHRMFKTAQQLVSPPPLPTIIAPACVTWFSPKLNPKKSPPSSLSV